MFVVGLLIVATVLNKSAHRYIFEVFVQEDASICRRYGGKDLGLTIGK